MPLALRPVKAIRQRQRCQKFPIAMATDQMKVSSAVIALCFSLHFASGVNGSRNHQVHNQESIPNTMAPAFLGRYRVIASAPFGYNGCGPRYLE
jgi:hypothetical protein